MNNAKFYLEDLKTKFRKININEYYLSYSGGKDSHLLYWFIKEYAPEFKDIMVVGVNTYMEHPQIRERLYKNCDRVLLPKLKPFEIKEKYGSPCFTKVQDYAIDLYQRGKMGEKYKQKILDGYFIDKNGNRVKDKFGLNKKAKELMINNKLHRVSNKCCKYLKKEPMHSFEKETGLKAILGVRGNESILRKNKYKSCFTKDKRFTPLWDLTDELENEIYKQFNIEIPDIYIYVSRTGCMGCPYGFKSGGTEKELQLLDENQHKFVCEYFKESYAVLGVDTSKQMTFDMLKGE